MKKYVSGLPYAHSNSTGEMIRVFDDAVGMHYTVLQGTGENRNSLTILEPILYIMTGEEREFFFAFHDIRYRLPTYWALTY